MTPDQAKKYHDGIVTGLYRLVICPTRKGWWVLMRREHDTDIPVRYIGPKNLKQIEQA